MKKILITGASGFVGSRTVAALHDTYELITPCHSELDITSQEAVESFISRTQPDAILHLAALSNTGYCELGLLSEDTALSPENHYGRHKILAERRAMEICPDSVALRTTWMYDSERPGMKTHRNFVINFQEARENGTPLRFATREFRGITWIEDVVRNIPHTFDLPGGVYNFGAENHLNSYETACEYARIQGIDPYAIAIPDPERFPDHIRNLSMSIQKAYEASQGKIRFLTTLEGLSAYIS